MNWLLIAEITYGIILLLVALRIVYDSRNSTKSLSYLMLIIFLPVLGMLIYFGVGINYRKRKIYSKKLTEDDELARTLEKNLIRSTARTIQQREDIRGSESLAYLLLNEALSPLTAGNQVRLLFNGEEKFRELIPALKAARHHIHLEYYIFEDGRVGEEIGQILIEKARQGVQVRFIYDAFGSISMSGDFEDRLREAGVEIYPFFKIYFPLFANRINYRNHRKIVVIDGKKGFTGGINVSDRYINTDKTEQDLYWRDTHVCIEGAGVQYLQYLFFCDWNFCSGLPVQPDQKYFPDFTEDVEVKDTLVQIAASGPDSVLPSILYSILKAISLAREEVLITTPYFIPGESLLNILIIAAYSGVRVVLLVPGISDSRFVQAATRSYYRSLLSAGIEVYEYQKGFIHAKTMVIDEKVAMVGTANMDLRSFDLNFEVNALIYDPKVARELKEQFMRDLQDAEAIQLKKWKKRPIVTKLLQKAAGLFSPLL